MTVLRGAAALIVVMLMAGCGSAADNNENNGETNNGATNNGTANNGDNNGTTANNGTNNGTVANNDTNNGTVANNGAAPSFADDVAPILIASCALNGCHLDPGNGTAFTVGDPADVAAVQAALDGVQTGGGVDMVVGGDLDNSELYLRITGTNRSRMPFGGQLSDADIDTITAWIEAGAEY